MSKYKVEIARLAEKQIAKLPKRDKIKILDKIETLADDPRPHGYKKLVYHTEYFRFRVGNYRIIYQITDDVLLVTVVEITDRRDAY